MQIWVYWPFFSKLLMKSLGKHLIPSGLQFSPETVHQLQKLLSSVQLLSYVWLFATPWTAACQASLSITNSWSLLKLMSVESVMPSNHLILCCPLLLPPSIFPSIRVFSYKSVLCIRWPKYWRFSFSKSYYRVFFLFISRLEYLGELHTTWCCQSVNGWFKA